MEGNSEITLDEAFYYQVCDLLTDNDTDATNGLELQY